MTGLARVLSLLVAHCAAFTAASLGGRAPNSAVARAVPWSTTQYGTRR